MKLSTLTTHPKIILFDGVCNLCNASVSFVIRHDPKAQFKFGSLQWAIANRHLTSAENRSQDSIIYINKGVTHIRSTAALLILKELDHPLSIFHHLIVFPRWIRDPFYSLIATFRYRWFGKRNQCMVPSPEYKKRFLDIE